MKGHMKNAFIVIGILVLAIIGFVIVRRDGGTEGQVGQDLTIQDSMPAASEVLDDGSMESGDSEDKVMGEETMEQVDYELTMSNYEFSTELIEVEAGQKIRIKLMVESGMHDFVIDELDVQSQTLTQGNEQVIEIDIPEDAEGDYEFYCSIENHRALGMEGVLRVVSQ